MDAGPVTREGSNHGEGANDRRGREATPAEPLPRAALAGTGKAARRQGRADLDRDGTRDRALSAGRAGARQTSERGDLATGSLNAGEPALRAGAFHDAEWAHHCPGRV